MKKEIIVALLNAGLTAEELYNMGVLKVPESAAATEPAKDRGAAPDPAAATEPVKDQGAAPDPAAAADPAAVADPAKDRGDAVIAAINGLRNDIIKTVQQINLAGAERGGNSTKPMSVEEAITGLSKGV